MRDPYKVLGVGRDASSAEIKKAYRRLMLQYHPDKNPGDETALEMGKIINEAYEALSRKKGRVPLPPARPAHGAPKGAPAREEAEAVFERFVDPSWIDSMVSEDTLARDANPLRWSILIVPPLLAAWAENRVFHSRFDDAVLKTADLSLLTRYEHNFFLHMCAVSLVCITLYGVLLWREKKKHSQPKHFHSYFVSSFIFAVSAHISLVGLIYLYRTINYLFIND